MGKQKKKKKKRKNYITNTNLCKNQFLPHIANEKERESENGSEREREILRIQNAEI